MGIYKGEPISNLQGNHNQKDLAKVRIYPQSSAYIKDFRREVVIEGTEDVNRVLEGELDLIYKQGV